MVNWDVKLFIEEMMSCQLIKTMKLFKRKKFEGIFMRIVRIFQVFNKTNQKLTRDNKKNKQIKK